MKKRLLAFALAAALALSLILAGCSPASPSSSTGSTKSSLGTSAAGGEAVKAYFCSAPCPAAPPGGRQKRALCRPAKTSAGRASTLIRRRESHLCAARI